MWRRLAAVLVLAALVAVTGPIAYGEPFLVEARFERPQEESHFALTLEWGEGRERTLTMERTAEDPRLYRSTGTIVLAPLEAAGVEP